MIERCRDAFPISTMCRLLKVSPSGYYDWRQREPGPHQRDNTRLLGKIRHLHEESEGVHGSPCIGDDLRYDSETCSLNRVARLMKRDDLRGIPSLRRWKKRKSQQRPDHIINHLERDFTSTQAGTKWVTDIT